MLSFLLCYDISSRHTVIIPGSYGMTKVVTYWRKRATVLKRHATGRPTAHLLTAALEEAEQELD
jgi:hypothetical protein